MCNQVEAVVTDGRSMPRQDFRKAMEEAGASCSEIEALIKMHMRLDAWLFFGLSLVVNTARGIENRGLESLGIFLDRDSLWLSSLCTFVLGFVLVRYLIVRQVRMWIPKHHSGFDLFIFHTIRYRVSVRTLLGWTYFWILLVAMQEFLFVPSIVSAGSLALINVLFVLLPSYLVTGGWRISDPVVVDGQKIIPSEVAKTAGSIVGSFQAGLGVESKEKADEEFRLYLLDMKALRKLRRNR